MTSVVMDTPSTLTLVSIINTTLYLRNLELLGEIVGNILEPKRNAHKMVGTCQKHKENNLTGFALAKSGEI